MCKMLALTLWGDNTKIWFPSSEVRYMKLGGGYTRIFLAFDKDEHWVKEPPAEIVAMMEAVNV